METVCMVLSALIAGLALMICYAPAVLLAGVKLACSLLAFGAVVSLVEAFAA